MELNNEIWKIIPEFLTYEASNTGKIRRVKDGFEPTQAKCAGINGLRIDFYIDGKRYNRPVRRIIANLFIDNPHKLKNIGFRDDDQFNCSADNMFWTNDQRRGRRGYGIVGEDSNFAKLKDEDVAYILISKLSGCKLAQLFNVSHGCIYKILNGQTWPHFKRLSFEELQALANNTTANQKDLIEFELGLKEKTLFTSKSVKKKIKFIAKEKSLIPVPIRDKQNTVIYIDKGKNPKKAIENYKTKHKIAI